MKGAGVRIQGIALSGFAIHMNRPSNLNFFPQAGEMFFGRQIFGQRISSYPNRQLGTKPYDGL